jgi:hypothetical protein
LLDKLAGVRITFAEWSLYGIPLVLLSVPLAAFIVARVQRVGEHPFDVATARAAIDSHAAWTSPEKRLVPIALVTFLAWVTQPLVAAALPPGSWTDGTIAIIAALALFLLPDGTGYTIEYQLSIRSYKRKLIVTEFPTTEGSRIGGTSGANSVRTGLRFLRLLLREIKWGRP